MSATQILSQLKKRGFRTTKTRTALIEILIRSTEAQTALELISLLAKKHISINRSTIYRELAVLKEEGIVNEILLGENKSRFELSDRNCHHHLICINCGEIKHIQIEEANLFEKIQQKHNFKIKNHSLEFSGLCQSCQ